MILAIDFDGTLHMGQFPTIGIPMPYAIEKMKQLKADGHYIIIHTCRSNGELLEAINWMIEKGIPFDRVNDNHPDGTALHNNNSRKVYADVYVDDRQVGGLPTWPEIYEYIASFVQPQVDRVKGHITFPYAFDYVEEQAKQAVFLYEERKEVIHE